MRGANEGNMMRLNHNELWSEAVDLVRRNRTVAVALAGALLFLPHLLVAYLAPMPARAPGIGFFEAAMAHARAHWPLILAGRLVEMLGLLTLLRLFVKPDGRTVGAMIAAVVILLPTMFAATFLANIAFAIGLLLLIVPGLYVLGRISMIPAAIAVEGRRNPIDAIRRSLALTRNHGFAIAWVFVALLVVAAIAGLALRSAFGSAAILLAGQETGIFVASLVGALVAAATSLLQAALIARIYVRLAATPTVPASR
jgi:hypothetical protein